MSTIRASGPAIEAVAATKTYKGSDRPAIDAVDLAIGEGEFFSILGPSGCGKTTLLRSIAGFETLTSGSILLHGSNVTTTPPNKRDVNLVFQQYALFAHLSVAENIAFGLKRRKLPKAEIVSRVAEIVDLVELAGKEHQKPRELSGGQQQRVALARALVNRPRALLLDEPLAALDLKLRQTMQSELKRIQREVGITFVFVTHDQNEAMALSDRAAVMNLGRVEQLASPTELYERPQTAFVANFLGNSALLDATVSEGETGLLALPDGTRVPAGPAASAGRALQLVLRAERLVLTAPGTESRHGFGVPAVVTEFEFLGSVCHWRLLLSDGTKLGATAPSAAIVEGDRFLPGDRVNVSWDPATTAVLATSPTIEGAS